MSYLGSFQEGFAAFQASNYGSHGYISKEGVTAIPDRFREAGNFHEGLAPASFAFQRVGYINLSGKFVIPPQFSEAYPFSDGLARVKSNGKIGYIDKTGTYQIPPKYQEGSDFRNGIASIVLQGWNFDERCSPTCGTRVNALVRPDNKIIYTWSESDTRMWTGNGGAFMGSPPPLFEVTFSSSPTEATVFAVPYTIYDFDRQIEDSLARLRPFSVLDGTTPVTAKLFSQRYRVVFYKDAKKLSIDFDLVRSGAKVNVTFP